MREIITGTWPDKSTGLRHIAAGTLLNISAPSRWDTRTSCGMRVYACPDTSDGDVITCIRCLGAIKPRGILRAAANFMIQGLAADVVCIDEAQDIDLTKVGLFTLLGATP